jgi:hypothetical protein
MLLLPALQFSAENEQNQKQLLTKKLSLKLAQDKKPVKHFNRALWEGLGHMVYATASYWIRQDVMKEDWEYHFTWEDQKKRIFQLDGFRMDSNTFEFNWTHSLAGGMYYNYARTNHLNKFQSLVYSFTCAFAWESLVEFREVISINDMITTPMGGVSFGESMYQLGRYFRSQRPTFANKIARILSNPIMAFNEWLDRKKYKDPFAYGEGEFWGDCRLVVGPRFDTMAGESANTLTHVGLESQVFHLPGYGEPGSTSMHIKDTLFSEFNLGATYSKKGMYEFDVYAKAVLFGHFSQNIQGASDNEAHDRRGYSFFVGAASVFDVMNINPDKLPTDAITSAPDKADKHCIINLIGPTMDLTIYSNRLKLRFGADAYADFALIHSHAFKRYKELFPVGVTKCILAEHGYYYALGVTLSSLLQIQYANLELKGSVRFHYFDSIDGMDRFQPDITPGNDFKLKDRRVNYQLSLGYHIPRTPIQVAAGLEQIERWGTVESFAQSSKEKRSYLQIQYLF